MTEITRNLVDFYASGQKSIMERLENSEIKNLASVHLGGKSTKKLQKINRGILMTMTETMTGITRKEYLGSRVRKHPLITTDGERLDSFLRELPSLIEQANRHLHCENVNILEIMRRRLDDNRELKTHDHDFVDDDRK